MLMFLGLAGLAGSPAQANELAVQITPYLNLRWETSDGNLEAGPDVSFAAGSVKLKPFLSVPLTDKDSGKVELTRHSSNWQVGGHARYEFPLAKDGSNSFLRLGLKGAWGRTSFEYYPTYEDDVKTTVSAVSTTFELQGMYYWDSGGTTSNPQAAPQVLVTYVREPKAADPVGVVTPASATTPAITHDLVVEPPSTRPRMSFTMAAPFYLGTGDFYFGPLVSYTMKGATSEYFQFGGAHRLRIEGWVYYAPSEALAGARVGVAPFLDVRVSGADTRDLAEVGAVFQLKFDTTMLEI